MSDQLLVQETFFETVQGEGHWTGHLADFIRLGGCPVGCNFCDSGWSKSTTPPKTELISIGKLTANLVSPICVITGGEPFIQPNLSRLVNDIIYSQGKQCHIETSGVHFQDITDNAWITLSPKETLSQDTVKQVDEKFWSRANEIKIVVSTEQDFYHYQQSGVFEKIRKDCKIFVQPEWNNLQATKEIALAIVRMFPSVRLSLQTHKFIGVR